MSGAEGCGKVGSSSNVVHRGAVVEMAVCGGEELVWCCYRWGVHHKPTPAAVTAVIDAMLDSAAYAALLDLGYVPADITARGEELVATRENPNLHNHRGKWRVDMETPWRAQLDALRAAFPDHWVGGTGVRNDAFSVKIGWMPRRQAAIYSAECYIEEKEGQLARARASLAALRALPEVAEPTAPAPRVVVHIGGFVTTAPVPK